MVDVMAAPIIEAFASERPDLTTDLKSKILIRIRDASVAIVPRVRTPMEQFMAEHYTERDL